jgi:hypothetical protein
MGADTTDSFFNLRKLNALEISIGLTEPELRDMMESIAIQSFSSDDLLD